MKDPATWNQLADEIRALKAENAALKADNASLRGRGKPERKMIYLAQPYGNKPENYVKAQKLLMAMQETYRGLDFISPVVSYSYTYDAYTYERGINYCLSLLSRCDALWVCMDDGNSKGVKIERAYAQEHGIPIKEFATQLDAVEGKEIV